MPFANLVETPLKPGASPVSIHYRETGVGSPLVFLHGGWGYEAYPFNLQIEAFGDSHRIIIPDRSGYGLSPRIEKQEPDFHRRAALETERLLTAIGVNRAALWGHSDGAVIAALMGIAFPDRVAGVILEAFHFYRVKPGSREFFEGMTRDPDKLGERIVRVLAAEHGDDYWRTVIRSNGQAWREIADASRHANEDLFEGRLSELRVPALFLHGRADPRTEAGEIEAAHVQAPHATLRMIERGKHSPHSEKEVAPECNQAAADFLSGLDL